MAKIFDIFLSHNSKDKPAVRELAKALRSRGLKVWLDEWELVPGRPWQEVLEEVIETTGASAVLVSKNGLGPWQDKEMRGCLCEFVNRNLPVIPVLLPGAPEVPSLPLFLKGLTWVDLRRGLTEEGIERIQWGATGKRPDRSKVASISTSALEAMATTTFAEVQPTFRSEPFEAEAAVAVIQKQPVQYRDILLVLYKTILLELKNPAKLRIFLSGGRGMGKTFLLSELANFSHKTLGTAVTLIDGRYSELAAQQLAHKRLDRSGLGAGRTVDLLLDDLDRLIVAAGAQAPPVLENLITHLSELVSALTADGRRCVFTSRFPASRMTELLSGLKTWLAQDRRTGALLAAFSGLIERYDNIFINPWPADWQHRIGNQVRELLPRLPASQQELCGELLIKLTGGHPALLVPALKQLVEQAKDRDLAAASPSGLKILIEDAAHREGIGVLRRALNGLREAEQEEWRRAYDDLLRLAQSGKVALSLRSREILIGEGLLFRDERDLQYVIPGEILIGELLGESMGTLRMEIVPDPKEPEECGSLRVWDHLRERRIPLSGGAWSVLKVIFEDPALVVSLSDICDRTHLHTRNAVRSAIQRLIGGVRAAGVDNILDNFYGKGYRKGEGPSWI